METNEQILKDYGWCQVIKRGENYFLNYDSGGFVVKMTEISVTKAESEIAINNEIEAENLIRRLTAK
ncbi:hypothetical protein ACFLS4_06705 [Bacteroidota bacterium]